MAHLPPLPESARGGLNEGLLAFLRGRARRGTPSQWDVDDYELHTHPDLIERLTEAAGWTRAEMCAAYGCPVLVHPNGVVFALALGMRALFFRLPPELRGGLRQAEVDPGIGVDWVAVEAWPADLTGAEGTRRVKQWCRRAYEHAGSLAHDGGTRAAPRG
jgi:hypothetical protein